MATITPVEVTPAVEEWFAQQFAVVGRRLSGTHRFMNNDLGAELHVEFIPTDHPKTLAVEVVARVGGVDVTDLEPLMAVLPSGTGVRDMELEEVGRSCTIDLPTP